MAIKKRKKISICIPCYNEEQNILFVYNSLFKIRNKVSSYDFEFIFVDNGSTDKTRELINKLAMKDKKVRGIFLSRNFGPEGSSKAAFDHVRGDAVIGLAADLQDPPGLIPAFIKKWEEGYDIILGSYTKLEDNIVMTFFRSAFYKIFKSISNIEVPINVTGFGLIDRKVINCLNSLPERYRFSRGLLMWVGFKKIYIPYERRKRIRGKSSYNFFDYIHYSEKGIFGFSYLPLDLMVYLGFILMIFSFLFIIFYLFIVVYFGNPIKASIPILLAIMFFGGIQLMSVSIIGKYIEVIVEETKARPMYIIDKSVN